MQFNYQARDAGGRIQSGEINAATEEEASQQLRKDGLYLLSIESASGAPQAANFALFKRKVKRIEIIYFTNQLAVMVDAGVALANALEGLGRHNENPTFKKIMQKLQKAVESGEDFSVALSRFPKQFDKTYVNLIKASEASGSMAPMLNRIATQARSELETKQKVTGAMMYPAAMLVMCIGVCTFLLTYVFPKLSPMFKSRQIEVPTPTKIMMALSDAMIHQWYLFVIGAIVLITFVLYARRQIWGRIALDWLSLNMPLLGQLMRKVAISRSLRTLATTINAGVPMLEALELCAGVTNNYFYERTWMRVGDQVAAGRQIHEALEGDKLIPATILQMISSGESTGRLGHVLDKVSDYFDRDVANTIKSVSSLIEPLMVAVMGCVIGFIALAMLLPIFKLSTAH